MWKVSKYLNILTIKTLSLNAQFYLQTVSHKFVQFATKVLDFYQLVMSVKFGFDTCRVRIIWHLLCLSLLRVLLATSSCLLLNVASRWRVVVHLTRWRKGRLVLLTYKARALMVLDLLIKSGCDDSLLIRVLLKVLIHILY